MIKLRLPLLLAVAVGAGLSSSQAGPTATNAWQPIIFSSPANNIEISSNLMAHPPQQSSDLSLISRLRMDEDASPVSAFNNLPLPPGPGPVMGLVRRPKSSEDSRDWEFMTPAEIMGVAPDQILHNQMQGANGDNGDASSLTPLERLLERQNSPARFQAHTFGKPSSAQNVWANEFGETNDGISALFGSLQSSVSGPLVGNASGDNFFAGPNGNSSWSKLFGPPTPAPNSAQQQQPQQMQNVNQFMPLLNPDFTPVTAVATTPNTTSIEPQTSGSAFDSTQPLVNPVGSSPAPLVSGLSKPATWAPLPTVTQQASTKPVTLPAWAPQPPPWLSATPQPFAIPQSKF